jgi:integrase
MADRLRLGVHRARQFANVHSLPRPRLRTIALYGRQGRGAPAWSEEPDRDRWVTAISERLGLPRGRHAETCPVRAFDAWQALAKRKAGPLFRRISTAGRIGDAALHPDAVRRILSHRIAMAGITVEGFDRLSAHALRVGFITAAYDKGVRDENIMRHTRHRDLRTMRGYVQRAGLVSESPAGVGPGSRMIKGRFQPS